MAPPVLTVEQRIAALAKAREARTTRAVLFAELKTGELTLPDLFTRAESDGIVKNTRVAAALKALPGIGPITARRILDNLSIAEARRIGGLRPQQRWALIAATS